MNINLAAILSMGVLLGFFGTIAIYDAIRRSRSFRARPRELRAMIAPVPDSRDSISNFEKDRRNVRTLRSIQ
jgi:hypothetical protein